MKLLQKLSETTLDKAYIQKWLTQWYLAALMHKVCLLRFQARLEEANHPAFPNLGAIVADELGLGNPHANHIILLQTYLKSIDVVVSALNYEKDAILAVQQFRKDTIDAWVNKSIDFGIGTMRYFEEVGDDIHKAYLSAVKKYEEINPANRNITYFTYHGGGAEEHHAELLQEAKKLCTNQFDEEAGYVFGKNITKKLLDGIYTYVFE